MEKSEEKLNKQISKYYVEHACQISSTGTVAAELGLEPSRISELRGGRRQLTVSQAEKIKEIYGLPSTSQGHWMECELLSSKDLHKQFVDNGLAQHFIELIEMVNSERFINFITDNVRIAEYQVAGYEHVPMSELGKSSELEFKNSRLLKNYKIKLLNELMQKQEFHNWCDVFIQSGTFSDINKILETVNSTFVTNLYTVCGPDQTLEVFAALSQIYRLVKSNTYNHLISGAHSYLFGSQLQLEAKCLPNKEYVVVGKIVLETAIIKLHEQIPCLSVLGRLSQENHREEVSAINPAVFTHVTLRLYFTEQYRYLLEVHLHRGECGHAKGRRMLIEIENRQTIFDELEQIFSYFKIEHTLAIKQVKAAIALKGGYIPQAVYLD
jgi:plasmid maintenance system antidote protein VapI